MLPWGQHVDRNIVSAARRIKVYMNRCDTYGARWLAGKRGDRRPAAQNSPPRSGTQKPPATKVATDIQTGEATPNASLLAFAAY